MTAAPLRLVHESGASHEVMHLRGEVAKLKRLLQAASDELHAEKDARQRYFHENSRLKAALCRQEREQAENDVVDAVFEFWRAMVSPRAKLGPARTKVILARLRDKPPTTPREFLKAIVGAAFDPFVSDSGKVFNDLELVCRNESKFASFMERYYLVPDVQAFIEGAGGADAARALMELDRAMYPRVREGEAA
jgi:hypothetical protein